MTFNYQQQAVYNKVMSNAFYLATFIFFIKESLILMIGSYMFALMLDPDD